MQKHTQKYWHIYPQSRFIGSLVLYCVLWTPKTIRKRLHTSWICRCTYNHIHTFMAPILNLVNDMLQRDLPGLKHPFSVVQKDFGAYVPFLFSSNFGRHIELLNDGINRCSFKPPCPWYARNAINIQVRIDFPFPVVVLKKFLVLYVVFCQNWMQRCQNITRTPVISCYY